MAKLPENEFSKSRNFRELDEALKLSFLNIKNDMASLKEGLHQQSSKVADLGKTVKEEKADLVTVDKFNILKIKIGELNESMKKLWDVEKKLEDLDKKAVIASEFDKQSSEVDAELSDLKKKVNELSKTSSTEEQAKQLAEDVSEEFDKVKKAIEELRSIKDTITKGELEKRTSVLNKRADDVRKDVDKIRAEVKDKVKVEQVEALVKDINSEFDRIKSQIADIKLGEKRFASGEELDREIAKLEKRMSDASEKMSAIVEGFTKGVEVTLKDFIKVNEKNSQSFAEELAKVDGRVSKEADGLWKELKTLVTKKQAENLVADINKEFDRVKSDLDRNSKGLSQLAKASATKDEAHSMFDDLRHRLDDTNSAMKDRFDDLVKRIKKESDLNDKKFGLVSQDIAEVDKSSGKEFKQVIYRVEFHKELDAIQKEFERLHKEMKGVESRMSESSELDALNKKVNKSVASIRDDYVERKHFDRLVDVVSVLQDRVEMQKSLVKEKKKELKAYAKELKAAKKASKRLAKYESQVEKVSSKKAKLEKKSEGNGKGFLANFLIGAAFVILIAAIGFFFAGYTGITDILSIAAVVCFVLGIIIRIVAALKNGN